MANGDTADEDLRERLRVSARASKTPACPEQDRLLFLAAGQMDPPEARDLLTHVAGCGWCGALLRQATRNFAEPPTGDEMETAQSARLANPDNRLRLAERLAPPSSSVPAAVPRESWARWWPAAAALAAALVAGVVFETRWAGGAAGAGRLLCQAYTDHRQLEMPLSGCAGYGPMRSSERGLGTSRLNRPPELMEAEARIARALEAHADDPKWLQLQGRADMLEGNAEAAIAELDRAHTLRPNDASVLSDLGIANFQWAKAKSDPRLYAAAFEYFSQGTRLQPNDPALVFNRALAAEKIFAFSEARDGWEAYLKLDSTSGWATEARAHLEAVKKNSIGSSPISAPPPPMH
jgi:tetratricopeptide (TPR) repeat protein